MHQVSASVETQRPMEEDPQAGISHRYPAEKSQLLGTLQIIIGIALVIMQIFLTFLKIGQNYEVAPGIWCGLFFIVAGSVGYAAGSKRRTHLITTSMLLSILAYVIFVWPVIAIGAMDLYYASFDDNEWFIHTEKFHRMRITGGLMVALGIIEAIVALIASVICCDCFYSPGNQDIDKQELVDAAAVQQHDIMTGEIAAQQ